MSQRDGMTVEQAIVAFDDFLNEPRQAEEPPEVRDYRFAAYAEWQQILPRLLALASRDMVRVPREPTDEMFYAFKAEWDRLQRRSIDAFSAAYAAMLAAPAQVAAPKVNAEGQGNGGDTLLVTDSQESPCHERCPAPSAPDQRGEELAKEISAYVSMIDATMREFPSKAFHLLKRAAEQLSASPADRGQGEGRPKGSIKPDNERQVFFYEQDHYYLSNFSAFKVNVFGHTFDTSEQAYHWARFLDTDTVSQHKIRHAHSAHDAFRYAQGKKDKQRPDWDDVKVDTMRDILRAKVDQHEYVRRKLLQTGDRELIEDSHRDPFWGWGEDHNGQNMLGKLWMEVRSALRAHRPGEARDE